MCRREEFWFWDRKQSSATFLPLISLGLLKIHSKYIFLQWHSKDAEEVG